MLRGARIPLAQPVEQGREVRVVFLDPSRVCTGVGGLLERLGGELPAAWRAGLGACQGTGALSWGVAESWEVCAEGLGEGPEVCGGVHGEAAVLVVCLAGGGGRPVFRSVVGGLGTVGWGTGLVGRGWCRGRWHRLMGWEAKAGVVAPCVGVDGALHAPP